MKDMKNGFVAIVVSFVLFLMPMKAFAITGSVVLPCSNNPTASVSAGTTQADSDRKLQLEGPYDGNYPDGDYWASGEVEVSGFEAGDAWYVQTLDPSGNGYIMGREHSGSDLSFDIVSELGSAIQLRLIGNIELHLRKGANNYGSTSVRLKRAVSAQGMVVTFDCTPYPVDPGSGDPGSGDPGSGDPGSGDPGSGDPGPIDPPPCNCPCPDWDEIADQIGDAVWDAIRNGLPPIPDPPDPQMEVPPPGPNGFPADPSTDMTVPAQDIPQVPQSSGSLSFDLNQNQPVIDVPTNESRPIHVSNPVDRLQHDPVNYMPKPGNETPPSDITTPQFSGLPAPSYDSQTQTSGGNTNPPVPSNQAPSGSQTVPSASTPSTQADRRVGSDNPYPVTN
jgi:hypothetical protein